MTNDAAANMREDSTDTRKTKQEHPSSRREKAVGMVLAERDRQDAKWGAGSRNHPFEWMSILGEEYGELCQAVNESCFINGDHPERGGTENVIKEAAQAAAVAVAFIEQCLAEEEEKKRKKEAEKALSFGEKCQQAKAEHQDV